jgi:hypothetical protein
MSFLRKWLEKRRRVVSDRPSAMQELIDSEAGYRQVNKMPRDCYRRLSEVPDNQQLQWGE